MVDLSVIIVNWNGRDLLQQCLDSLVLTAGALTHEVIVVDNASTDGSPELVRQSYPQVRLVENRDNVGFSRANNQGIRLATGRYMLLLNSDTIVKPGALEAMVALGDRHPRIGVVGAELRNLDGSLQPSWAAFPTWLSETLGRNFRVRRPMVSEAQAYQVDWVGGACLLARREAIAQVGPLDEAIFMYTEETDWCYRFARAGWGIVYLDGAQVIHLGGGSSRRSSVRSLIELQKSKVYFFNKHYGRWSAQVLRATLAARALIKMGLVVWRGQEPGSEYQRQRALWMALSQAGAPPAAPLPQSTPR
jgi:GT2 family glycosyltransferase